MIDAVVFDCDGTLSRLEGIVELARMNGVQDEVRELTELAMGSTGMSPQLFSDRLQLVQPTLAQTQELAELYFEQRSQDIDTVLHELREREIPIYVVSAGINPAVMNFAALLQIEPEHVFAVDVLYGANGEYVDFAHDSPMTEKGGKTEVIDVLSELHSNILYVGDGMNDLAVKDQVAVFVGYGGNFYRETIRAQCEHYLSEPSLLPLLDFLG